MLKRILQGVAVAGASLLILGASGRGAAAQLHDDTGRDLYATHCACCHGRDAKGGGVMAVALKTPPTDLTLITARNGGTFPAARMKALIAGPDNLFIPAHGSSDMPVWGPTFRALDPGRDVGERVALIVGYLEQIQAK